MRASETVSEASPSSTASQTGVPTQVVQQVQGTQQVGHVILWGTMLSSTLPRTSVFLSYQDMAAATPTRPSM